jgi:HEAT repeat protein
MTVKDALDALREGSTYLKVQALNQLFNPDEEGMDKVIDLALADADEKVRELAFNLFPWDLTADHIKIILPFLEDSSEDIRRRAQTKLIAGITPQALPVLAQLFKKDKDLILKGLLIISSAWIKLGKKEFVFLHPQYIELFDHEDAQVRVVAARFLGMLAETTAIDTLTRMLDGPKHELAAQALCQARDDEFTSVKDMSDIMIALIKKPGADVANNMRALMSNQGKKAEKIVKKALKDATPAEQENLNQALEMIEVQKQEMAKIKAAATNISDAVKEIKKE